MRNAMRFLMMFGPIIYRQYNKYMAKKQRQQPKENEYVDRSQDEMNPKDQPKQPDLNDKDFV